MKDFIENKTIAIFIAIIIIIGIIMIAMNGFYEETKDINGKRISIYMYQEFEKEDIKNIVQEVLNKEVEASYIGFFKDAVSINVEDVSEEEITTIKDKIAEKYTWEEGKQSITTNTNIKTNLFDECIKYIPSYLISFVLIAIYLVVRFKSFKSLINLVETIIISELLIFSLIAIARIPLNEKTFIMSIFAYMLAVIITANNMTKKYYLSKEEKLKEE